MKKRRMMAILLAATMVVGSSTTVLAAEGDVSGSIEVSGNGDVKDVNTKKYNVVLPTSQAMTLQVDPKGLSGLVEEGDTATDKDLEAFAGLITCSDTPVLLNKGSVEAKVSVELELNTDATVLSNADDVHKGTDNNMLLYAAPSLSKVTTLNGDGYKAVPDNGGIVITSTAQTLDFVLPATPYHYTLTSGNYGYEKDDPDTGDGTAIEFGGWANKNADWLKYTDKEPVASRKKIALKAVFAFTENSDNTEALDTAGTTTPYGLATSVSANQLVDVPSSTPAPGALTFVKQSNGNYTCTVTGAPTDGTISDFVIDGSSRSGAITNGKITYTNQVLTLDSTLPFLGTMTKGTPYVSQATINGTVYNITLTVPVS